MAVAHSLPWVKMQRAESVNKALCMQNIMLTAVHSMMNHGTQSKRTKQTV